MKEKPYQASDDDNLFKKLKSLYRCGITPSHIETDGVIEIEIIDAHDIDYKIDASITEYGIVLNSSENQSSIQISTETLMQLAAMSTCFAAGYAKARQEHEEKQT